MEYNKIQNFKDLKAWQEGHRLVIGVYKRTKPFPREEIYSLVDQMRRAAVSITSNIAEGFGRHSYKEKANFYRMAEGSLTELENQLLVSRDIGYLKQGDFDSLQEQLDLTHRLLCGLISKTKSFISSSRSILFSIFYFAILLSTLYSLFSPLPAQAATINKPINFLFLNTGLVGHWTFDGPKMVSNVADSSGLGNNGYMSGFTSTSSAQVAGKLGQGLSFDGADDWVNPSENSGLPVYGTTGYSVSLWVKGSVPGSDAVIYSEGSSASTYQIFRMQVRTSGGNKLNVNIRDDVAVNLLSVSSAGVVFDNRWHHIVWTDLNGAGKLYIDGQQDSYDFSYTPGTLTLNQSSIGALHRTSVSGYFPGSLDDVRVYNRALSVTEIRQLYNIGAASKVASTPKGIPGQGLNSGLVGHWTFDGPKMVSNVADSSGLGNNGYMSGFTSTSSAQVAGKLGQGLSFNGSSNYVSVVDDDSLDVTGPITISFWFKPKLLGNAQNIINHMVSGGTYGSGIDLLFYSSDKLLMIYNNGDNRIYLYSSKTWTSADLNKWYHAVYVYNGSSHNWYIDKVVSNGSGNFTADFTAGAPASAFNIGSRYSWNSSIPRYFNGDLDDVRVYNRVLSASEILQLYNMGR